MKRIIKVPKVAYFCDNCKKRRRFQQCVICKKDLCSNKKCGLVFKNAVMCLEHLVDFPIPRKDMISIFSGKYYHSSTITKLRNASITQWIVFYCYDNEISIDILSSKVEVEESIHEFLSEYSEYQFITIYHTCEEYEYQASVRVFKKCQTCGG